MSDDSFEAWMRRPVYVAQCHTWALAQKLEKACHRFRCLPAYRDDQSLLLRKQVADMVRHQRSIAREKRIVMNRLEQAVRPDQVTGLARDPQAASRLRNRLYQLQREEARYQ